MDILEDQADQQDNDGIRPATKCQCGGCNQYFVGMSAFEQHRISENGRRRCMTEQEMLAAGMAKEPRMVKHYRENKATRELRDVWYDVAGREEMRAAFADKR